MSVYVYIHYMHKCCLCILAVPQIFYFVPSLYNSPQDSYNNNKLKQIDTVKFTNILYDHNIYTTQSKQLNKKDIYIYIHSSRKRPLETK